VKSELLKTIEQSKYPQMVYCGKGVTLQDVIDHIRRLEAEVKNESEAQPK